MVICEVTHRKDDRMVYGARVEENVRLYWPSLHGEVEDIFTAPIGWRSLAVGSFLIKRLGKLPMVLVGKCPYSCFSYQRCRGGAKVLRSSVLQPGSDGGLGIWRGTSTLRTRLDPLSNID